MNNRRVMLVANGEKINRKLFRKIYRESYLKIAVDGGFNQFSALKLLPDICIGDFDSANIEKINKLTCKIINTPDQNYTDLQKAFFHIKETGNTEIHVISSLGKRPDHALYNLFYFNEIARDFQITLYDKYGITYILPTGKHYFDSLKNHSVSLISCGKVAGIHLTGFKYLPVKEIYHNYFPGISNKVIDDHCSVTIESGVLFMFVLYD